MSLLPVPVCTELPLPGCHASPSLSCCMLPARQALLHHRMLSSAGMLVKLEVSPPTAHAVLCLVDLHARLGLPVCRWLKNGVEPTGKRGEALIAAFRLLLPTPAVSGREAEEAPDNCDAVSYVSPRGGICLTLLTHETERPSCCG